MQASGQPLQRKGFSIILLKDIDYVTVADGIIRALRSKYFGIALLFTPIRPYPAMTRRLGLQ